HDALPIYRTPNALDLLQLEGGHRPVAGAARDVTHEVAEQLATLGRMHDLRMEHHAVVAALVVGAGRQRRALADADGTEPRRQPHDAVAMAHPDLLAGAPLPPPAEERA